MKTKYEQGTLQINIHKKTSKISIGLLTTVLKKAVKIETWELRGIRIDEFLFHLEFADDITVFANMKKELTSIIHNLVKFR